MAWVVVIGSLHADDKDVIPPRLPKEQRDHLQRLLKQHERPDRYVPADAKLVDAQPADVEPKGAAPNVIKQYLVQITPHRPVPGQDEVKQVDVYYYRPNPEKGKPGITVKHTVDVTTGNQVGQTEVLLNHHTPISRDELGEAVELTKEKSAEVIGLYQGPGAVRYEYLQLMVTRKNGDLEPGDRAVRLVFTAAAAEGRPSGDPVRVIVNLTKGTATLDTR